MLPLGRAESVNKGIYSQSLDVGGATRRELREVALNGPVDELSANLFKDTVATTRHAGSYDATINCPHVPAATIERDQHGNVCSILLAQRLEPESAANSFRAKLQAHPRGRETIDYTQYVD